MFVVVDLDVLLELAIFVPVFNLDEVLRTVSVSNYSASTQREQQGQGGRRGSATYAQDETLLHQAGQLPQATALVLAGTAKPAGAAPGAYQFVAANQAGQPLKWDGNRSIRYVVNTGGVESRRAEVGDFLLTLD